MIEFFTRPLFLINFLTGFIFVIAAIIQMKYPPRRINSLYGYRTKNSMKSNEAWEFAQKFSANLMLKFGIGLCMFSIIFQQISLSNIEFEIVISSLIITLVVILMIAIVEKELKKRF